MQPQLMICRKQYKNINPFFVGQSVFQVPLTWVFILNLEMTFSHAQIVIIFFMNSCAVGHFEVLAREAGFDQIALWDCFGTLSLLSLAVTDLSGSKFVVHYSAIMQFDTT